MTPIAKPTPRGPKPRRPLKRTAIARSRTPIARKARVKRMKTGERATLRREAERLCSRITLTAHPVCECGCGRPSTEAAHILGKKAWPRVRYYLKNLLALAHECHVELREATVDLTKPSAMRDLVFSLPHGRDSWESILWVASGPRHDIGDVVEGLRMIARSLGLKS